MSPDGDVTIRADTRVRCRLTEIQYSVLNYQWACRAVATVNEPHLGVVQA